MHNDSLALEDEAIRQIARRPRNLAETGLTQDFLCDLRVKHCHCGGILNQQQLVERTALAWSILKRHAWSNYFVPPVTAPAAFSKPPASCKPDSLYPFTNPLFRERRTEYVER